MKRGTDNQDHGQAVESPKMNILPRLLGSSKLALALVLSIILLSIAGAILPQEHLFTAVEIASWQDQHPTVTSLMRPLGLFHVFQSIPFLAVIFLLGINTLTCTFIWFRTSGGLSAFKGPGALKNSGFIVLHLSLIALFLGGAWSSAARLDGHIILTEGQTFKEDHRHYMKLVEGPLRREKHKGFAIRLNEVHVSYKGQWYPIDIASHLEIPGETDTTTEAIVKVNRPLNYQGLSFTQDQTGFSPRISIRDKAAGKLLVNAFVALKTFRGAAQNDREYRDFLPLPVFQQRKQRVIVTLYPDYKKVNDNIEKTGEDPDNPILVIEIEDETGQVVSKGHSPFKGSADVGDYSFTFEDLRRWSSFRVVEDPGYAVVWIALCFGMLGFILRYIPELIRWFSKEGSATPTACKDEKNIQGADNGTG